MNPYMYPYMYRQSQPQGMPNFSPTQAPTYPPPMQTPLPGVSTPSTKVGQHIPGMLPLESSYIENILRLNKGKMVTVYATFEQNREWNAKIFHGIIEAAGRDHLILSDPETGNRVLLPLVYLDYVTFTEPIEYEYPFGNGPLATSPPR